jgi:hypothetical protein
VFKRRSLTEFLARWLPGQASSQQQQQQKGSSSSPPGDASTSPTHALLATLPWQQSRYGLAHGLAHLVEAAAAARAAAAALAGASVAGAAETEAAAAEAEGAMLRRLTDLEFWEEVHSAGQTLAGQHRASIAFAALVLVL